MAPTDKKFCLYCEEAIAGRADKKFCDDQCRTSYNNKLKSESQFVREVNITLRKNRKILEELIVPSEGKGKTTRQKLIAKGFSFTYFTHTYTTRAGTTYFFCYEYGYLLLENDFIMVVKRNEA